MATQNYRSRSDSTVGANSGTKKIAPGHAPELQPKAGSENRTPPPVTTAQLALEKDSAWGRSGPQGNPGQNAYGGASSLSPGQKAAPATISAQAKTDVVLDNLVKVGSARGSDGDDWQTRSLTDPHDNPKGRVPVHPNTTGARSGGIVPAKCGTLNDDADTRYAKARGK